MFQDIAPHVYNNAFPGRLPSDTDFVLFIDKNSVLMESAGGTLKLPAYETARAFFPEAVGDLIYLFSVDETAFFLSLKEIAETDRFSWQSVFVFRSMNPGWMDFAGATATHLAHWYDTHRFCGRCAEPMRHKKDERALTCPACGAIEYPRISPVVIVGITDGDRLLLTKYAAGYNRYALVAGFVEIGETLENAVRREVLEEVGLKIRNLRYYKSQPWAFSGSLLSGFFAELDGDDTVCVDQNELSEAVWFDRKAIPPGDTTMSLTWTMIEAFRNGEI